MKFRLLLLLFFFPLAVFSNDTLKLFQPSPQLHRGRVIGVAATETVLGGGSLIGLHQLWYADYPQQPFHFFNDNDEWMQIDKAGHALSANTLARLSACALRWGGVKAKNARWYAVLPPLLYLSGIELLDGYSAGWGFSWGDCVAN
ncbi:MAG: DUF2279 domain-containing protein, partial [Bacteroidia bacterium]